MRNLRTDRVQKRTAQSLSSMRAVCLERIATPRITTCPYRRRNQDTFYPRLMRIHQGRATQ